MSKKTISLEQAAKLALEALEYYDEPRDVYVAEIARAQDLKAMTALREALMSGTDGAQQSAEREEPVAWRTFDGEGGYEYRSYDMNEQYAKEWEQRNPKHKGWVEPLYKDPTPCQTCEALARTVMMDQTAHDIPPSREWVGLTDEEIDEWTPEIQAVIRVIEDKLKEKNT